MSCWATPSKKEIASLALISPAVPTGIGASRFAPWLLVAPWKAEASELNWSVGFHDGACTSIILIGSLSHACTVIAPGRTFMRPLITTSYRAKNLSHWIWLDAEFHSDLAWWWSFLDTWNGCRDSNSFFLHAFRLDHLAMLVLRHWIFLEVNVVPYGWCLVWCLRRSRKLLGLLLFGSWVGAQGSYRWLKLAAGWLRTCQS